MKMIYASAMLLMMVFAFGCQKEAQEPQYQQTLDPTISDGEIVQSLDDGFVPEDDYVEIGEMI